MKLKRDVFRALATVVWADGVVTAAEADALCRAARASGLSGDDLKAVQQHAETRVELGSINELALDSDERVYVYAIAQWLAQIDGVAAEETQSLAQLAALLGLSDAEKQAAELAPLDDGSSTHDLSDFAKAVLDVALAPPATEPAELSLPPGSDGWPILGETLSFVSNPFEWVDARIAEHGLVFRSRVLGRRVAVIAGAEACELWLDEDQVTRDGAMFDHVFALFGGASLPTMDGRAHRTRKGQVLAAFDRAALQSYVPALRDTIAAALARWAESESIQWVQQLRTLSIECIARNMLGLHSGPEVDAIVADYQAVTGGFAAVPVNIPGTAMRRATKARDRLIALMHDKIAERRETPHDDGLARILAAEAPDGSTIGDDDLALEMHHIFLAGYIVFAELAAMIIRLDQHVDVREAVAAELDEQVLDDDITLAKLMRLSKLNHMVDEVKRITPMLPIVFGKANKDITIADHRIPAGWGLCLALHAHHMIDDVYPEPHTFDPGRFARGEHEVGPHAFIPQGPGPLATSHKCAGLDYATTIMQLFGALLLRGYLWELADRSSRYDLSVIPPEPKGGMPATVRRR